MASVQKKGNGWYGQFIYRGKRHTFTIGKVSEAEARAKADQVDYLLMRIDQGLIPPPPDILAFIRHDGNAKPEAPRQAVTLAALRDRYLETHTPSLEPHTIRGIRRHFQHLAKHFGERFHIGGLTLADLQGYVDKRAKAKTARGLLNPATIKKEIVSLRTAWNWGVRMDLVSGVYPYRGLRYAKTDEKPPFQTRQEIERQLPGLGPAKQAELWEALYLTLPEIEQLISHVKATALHPWIHPLVATAAHTGARKGELLRMRVGDVDFEAGVVTIKEKKRAHDRRTTRRVPLSDSLTGILKEWLAVHPGGDLLFAQAEEVAGSKKRSANTGYFWKNRPGGNAARLANVRPRGKPGILPITEEEAHHHLKQSLKSSAWSVIRGYHICRHSFISALASKGIDQRIIDEMVGHQSEQQRRRYRHLYPAVIKDALKSVFH